MNERVSREYDKDKLAPDFDFSELTATIFCAPAPIEIASGTTESLGVPFDQEKHVLPVVDLQAEIDQVERERMRTYLETRQQYL